MKYRSEPIETLYSGILYRSLIEARTAYFYDVANIDCVYERSSLKITRECTGVCVAWYRPDFWVNSKDGYPGHYVEVKADDPTDDEVSKCMWLSSSENHRVIMLIGQLGPRSKYIVFQDGDRVHDATGPYSWQPNSTQAYLAAKQFRGDRWEAPIIAEQVREFSKHMLGRSRNPNFRLVG